VQNLKKLFARNWCNFMKMYLNLQSTDNFAIVEVFSICVLYLVYIMFFQYLYLHVSCLVNKDEHK